MNNINGFVKDQLCKEISKDGATLKIISKKFSEGEWQLAILNEKGISSNWLESFPTAQLAIDAGIKAIEEEGVKEFIDVEGFDY
jgi:hypothetical protein